MAKTKDFRFGFNARSITLHETTNGEGDGTHYSVEIRDPEFSIRDGDRDTYSSQFSKSISISIDKPTYEKMQEEIKKQCSEPLVRLCADGEITIKAQYKEARR